MAVSVTGAPRRYRLDTSTELVPGASLLLGGSPLRLLRLTPRGHTRVLTVAAGAAVRASALTERLVDAGAIHPVARPARSRRGETTVVVPSRGGRHDHLVSLVRACAGTARIVIVDDGSEPPLGPVAGAEIVRHGRSGGPAAARNTGWRAATTDYVAFVDDDVLLGSEGDSAATGEWLDTLLGHFDDPKVDAVAPRVRSVPGDGLLERYERDDSPLDLGTEAAVVRPGGRVSYVPAATIVMRRSALEAIGGFDDGLRFGEDVDAIWRLTERGRRCRYEPSVCVHHRPRPTWKAWAEQRRSYGRSAAPLARRHRGALAPIRTTGWSLTVWALVASRRPLPAAAVAAFTAVSLHRKVRYLGIRRSTRLALLGHLHAGRLLAEATRRAWWPIVAVGAIRARPLRRALLLSVAALLADGASTRSPQRAIVRLADDVAYSAGLWSGVLRLREPGPIRPSIFSWPGRDTPRRWTQRWPRAGRWLRSDG